MSFEFHPGALQAINATGRALLSKIEFLELGNRPEPDFRSERPITATITKDNLVEDPVIWARSSNGVRVIAFIFREDAVFGLSEENHSEIRRISDAILKTKWARDTLSLKFLEEKIIQWCRSSYGMDQPQELADAISAAAKNAIQSRTMWAPIAHLEVQSSFDFGFASIQPISKDMIDNLEEQSILETPQQAEQLSKLFERMRSEMQGLGAVVFDIVAEPNYAYDKGLKVANDAIGLLRFFSEAARNPWLTCLNSPLGAEYAPKSNVILFGPEGSFSWRTGLVSNNLASWAISENNVRDFLNEGFEEAGFLLDESSLNQFQLKVRSSLLAYTKGATLVDINDRLVYTLSALESLFLRNSFEPIQQNLGERMAFLVGRDRDFRKSIVKTVRDIYSMRSQYVHHRISSVEEQQMTYFFVIVRAALQNILSNIRAFEKTDEFLDAVDNLKFGNSTSSE